jgi:rod shape-determining protein MreD
MKDNILLILQFIILVLVQVLLFNQIHIYGVGCIFLYVLFVINYPFERKKIYLVVWGFLLGFIIDIFSQSYGIHAFATTLIAYLRPFIIKLYAGSDDSEVLRKNYNRFGAAFYKDAVTMILIHHFTLFMLEAFSLKFIVPVIIRTIVSTLLTTIFVFFVQSVLVKRK